MFIFIVSEDHSKKATGKLHALQVIPQVKERMSMTPLHNIGLDGDGISIIILDGGISLDIPEFKDKSPTVTCFGQMPPTFHGTACAAIAGGAHMGIAPGSCLTVCQVSPDGKNFDESKVVEFLQRLVHDKENGTYIIDIVSMSFGFEKTSAEISKHIEKLTSLGVVCVAASGNAGRCQNVLAFPARDKNVISVGACKPTGQPCDSNPEVNIDVYAPGEDIEVPGVQTFSGSSAATPVIAGIVALMLQCANKLPQEKNNVKKLIRNVETLKLLFAHDMMERGKRLFAPHELLKKWWNDPSTIERTLLQYHM